MEQEQKKENVWKVIIILLFSLMLGGLGSAADNSYSWVRFTNDSIANVNRSEYWDNYDTPYDLPALNSTSWTRSGTNVHLTNINDRVCIGCTSASGALQLVGQGTTNGIVFDDGDGNADNGIYMNNYEKMTVRIGGSDSLQFNYGGVIKAKTWKVINTNDDLRIIGAQQIGQSHPPLGIANENNLGRIKQSVLKIYNNDRFDGSDTTHDFLADGSANITGDITVNDTFYTEGGVLEVKKKICVGCNETESKSSSGRFIDINGYGITVGRQDAGNSYRFRVGSGNAFGQGLAHSGIFTLSRYDDIALTTGKVDKIKIGGDYMTLGERTYVQARYASYDSLIAKAPSGATTGNAQIWSNAVGSEVAVVDKDGNFGLMTKLPTHRFNLVGSANITDDLYVENQTMMGNGLPTKNTRLTIKPVPDGKGIDIIGTDSGRMGQALKILASSTANAELVKISMTGLEGDNVMSVIMDSAGSTGNTMVLQNDGSGSHLTTKASNEDLRIDTNGNGNIVLLSDEVEVKGSMCLEGSSSCSTPATGDLELEDGSACIGNGGCTPPAGDGNLLIEGTLETQGVYTATNDINADASILLENLMVFEPNAQIIANNGVPLNLPNLNLILTTTGITVDCQDGDGCTVTLTEPALHVGDFNIITCISVNTCTMVDVNGVAELQGNANQVLGQYDSIMLWYVSDRWVQIAPIGNV